GEGGPGEGDLDALAARWPGWRPRLAELLMHDPVGDCRRELAHRLDGLEPPSQHEPLAPCARLFRPWVRRRSPPSSSATRAPAAPTPASPARAPRGGSPRSGRSTT